jgi:hypothetical protein
MPINKCGKNMLRKIHSFVVINQGFCLSNTKICS